MSGGRSDAPGSSWPIDAHRAAPAAVDFEGRPDDRVARQTRRYRLEIRYFPGRGAADHTDPPRWVRVRSGRVWGRKRPGVSAFRVLDRGRMGNRRVYVIIRCLP